jgi:phosphopantothenoylcysteine decarboxylase / phosphopantothenate---cysteine ligase
MKLLLCVTGGIAAYKACELTSLAVKAGHEVRVLMSRRAKDFVGPLSFAGLSGHAVFSDDSEQAMDHIELARWAEVACVAPLTAHTLGKLACGLCDDLLSTTLMALPARTPVVLGPAMNTQMWENPVVVRNLGWLQELGRYTIVAPVEKRLACGDVGPGGLADPAELLAACERVQREAENLTLA